MTDARRVLVVDDDPSLRQLLSALLTSDAFEVTTADDAENALTLLETERYDLFVFDVMMPTMDGLELTRRVKADDATSAVPVVLLTALDGSTEREAGELAGADSYLTKPFSPLELLETVERLVT